MADIVDFLIRISILLVQVANVHIILVFPRSTVAIRSPSQHKAVNTANDGATLGLHQTGDGGYEALTPSKAVMSLQHREICRLH